ncbi:hypothetical protein CORC01_11165 [Colletotrichum orchidophilum]|uniref:Uncharacterized protein n=1 Tax=Colletotrichum orchidophilum TaxID=1209926 RepID=A0A1G4AWM6_9PEZI|nr:uncharacterized protein CORC01_11165 [Colletotrichum orchidophilum]OHE93568.1 hypothetical protein CORC01_11165 [Colletotrichum orchidophilum]
MRHMLYRSRGFKSRGPLALQIYGPEASGALQEFYEDEENKFKTQKKFILHFTFDQYDSRRNSSLKMATSFIAQILSAIEPPASTQKLLNQREFLRAWTLYDALYILEDLIYGMEVVCLLINLDQCETSSREQLLDTFRGLILMTESKLKILAFTKEILPEWPGKSLNTEQTDFSPSYSSEVELRDYNTTHSVHSDTASTQANKVSNSIHHYTSLHFRQKERDPLRKFVEMLVADANAPESSVQDIVRLVLNIQDAELRDAIILQFMGAASIIPVETLLSLEDYKTPEAFFRHLLSKIQESERRLVRQILSRVLLSIRPLSVQELSMVVFWIQQREIVNGPAMTEEYGLLLRSSIATLLWGILAINNNNDVGISHSALRDLLLGQGVEWFRMASDSHRDIVVLCLELLHREEFLTWKDRNKGVTCSFDQGPILISRSMFEDRTTLYEYVVMNWPEHYNNIPESKRPRVEVMEFFGENSMSAWRSWAESRWTMSNPMNRADRLETLVSSACPLSLIAGIGDPRLVKDWADAPENRSFADTGIALEEASRAGMMDVVKYLLALEPGHFRESHFQSALIAAASSAESQVLDVLIQSVPENLAWPASLLLRVSELGFEACVVALLSHGCSPNALVEFPETTALLRAVGNGHASICKLLLDHDADVDDSGGHGVIMTVAAGGSPRGADVIKTLIAHKIDVGAKDGLENSALNESSRLGHFEVSRTLAHIARDPDNNFKPELPEIEKCLDLVADLDLVRTALPLLDMLSISPGTHSILARQLKNAVKHGRVEFARVLFQREAVTLSEDTDTHLLCDICGNPDSTLAMLMLLVEYGANPNWRSGKQTPLTVAARLGRIDFIEYLIENGAGINNTEPDSLSALSEAARQGSLECVRYLVHSGADIDWRDGYGESALFEAAEAQHFEVVGFLLDQGATASGSGWNGRTPLSLSLSSVSTMRQILALYPETEMKDHIGLGPIHRAAMSGQAAAIDVLLEFKAQVDLEGSEGLYKGVTPLLLAVTLENCDLASIQSLLEGGADVDFTTKTTSFTAIQLATSPGVIEALLQYSPSINSADSHGKTALIHRTNDEKPQLAAVKKLVNARAEVNAVCKNGCCSPLLNLIRRPNSSDNWPIIEYLIGKGADINMRTFRSGGVLNQACYYGDLWMVKHLHARGADVNAGIGGLLGSPLQATCLSTTADHEVLEIMRYLVVEAKADVNQSCGYYGSALGAACMRRSPHAIKLLLDYGAAANILDRMGRLPIHLAAVTAIDSFQHLLDINCDVYAADNTGRTVLQWAAQSGDVEIVRLVLSLPDIEVDQVDKDGWTALCWAARGVTSRELFEKEKPSETQTEIIELLLERKASQLLVVPGDAAADWYKEFLQELRKLRFLLQVLFSA